MNLRSLLFALLAVAIPVQAESRVVIIDTDGFGHVLVPLHDTPCANPEVLKHIPLPYRGDFQAGDAVVKTKPVAICWSTTASATPMPEGAMFIVDANGESGMVRKERVRPAEKL